jgi:hypothetical protein
MNFNEDFKQIGNFDTSGFLERVQLIEEETWAGDTFRQENYKVHQHTQTIKLIMDEDGRHENPTYHPMYHELYDLISPLETYIKSKLDNTLKAKRLRRKNGRGYFIRMILVKLKAKTIIPAHIDKGDTLLKCHRIHLPIISNDKNIFSVGVSKLHLKPGELWEINNRHEHGVVNGGNEDRIHLIIDYVIPGEKIIDTDGSKLTC